MNDNFFQSENPFNKIDKSRFADESTFDRNARRKAEIIRNIQADIPKEFEGDDEALFLSTVGSIRKRSDNPIKRGEKNKKEEQNPDITTNEESFASVMKAQFGKTVQPLAKSETKKQKKNKKLTEPPVQEVTSQEEKVGSSKIINARIHAGAGSGIAEQLSQIGIELPQDQTERDNIPLPKIPKSASDSDMFGVAMRGVKILTNAQIVSKPKATPLINRSIPNTSSSDKLERFEFSTVKSGDFIEGSVLGIDATLMERLRQGLERPEVHVDLHFLNSSEACEQLVNVIRNAYNHGNQVVLIVYGKGKHSPTGYGVLKEKLPQWLVDDPFKYIVLAFCTAQPKDGGEGAMYILLRSKTKNNTYIQWDKRPHDPDLYLE